MNRWLAIVIVLALFGCGGKTTMPSSPLATHDTSPISAIDTQPDLALQNVDPELIAKLSAELERAMVEHNSLKRIAAAPTSELSKVIDFRVGEITGEGTTFEWSYRNQGDYDQNGEVNLADITPIALFYGMAEGQEGWGVAKPVDGDGNGEINLADITPIATQYGNAVNGYIWQVSATPENEQSWVQFETVVFNTGVLPDGGSHLKFSIIVPNPSSGSYLPGINYISQVIPFFGNPDSSPELGIASNSISEGTQGWQIQKLGSGGAHTSLAVVDGNPAVSYLGSDGNISGLMYVRATNVEGSSWGTPQTVDISTDNIGLYTSLCVADGIPAISYWDATNGYLKFVRATNADGSSWGTPQTVDSTGNVGWYTSLCIVNGNPAICYQDYTNWELKFVRATDATGSSWGTPQTVGNWGLYTSLCIVNGNPAISYCDDNTLKYVRATDADGNSWAAPSTPDSTFGVGIYSSLCVVDGNPAISYRGYSNWNLMYVRATNVEGSSWGTPQIVDSNGWSTSLAVVNGRPAISYYDSLNYDLKYIWATSADGSNWGTPQTLDTTGYVGLWSSLCVVDGNPAISYDGYSGLKYVRFY